MLNTIGPKPMIEPEKLKSEADWLAAGRVVFEQMDHIHLRTYDPKFIEAARRGESAFPRSDGTAANLRWVPTKDGVALTFPNCSNCHVAKLKDGTEVPALLSWPTRNSGPDRPVHLSSTRFSLRKATSMVARRSDAVGNSRLTTLSGLQRAVEP